MPLISTRRPRRSQPQGAARFNRAVLPGLPLVLLSAGAGCRNLAGERYFSNSVSIKPGPDGLGYAFDGTQEISLGLSDPGSLLPCVFFGVFRVAVAKAWSAIMYDRSGVNGATFGSDGLKLHYVWDGSEWAYSTGLTFAVGELVSFAYCVRSDSVSIAMNGKFDKRTVSNSARSIGASTLVGSYNWIGSDPAGGRQFNGSVYLAGLVAGDWRDELLIEFSRNPWQVFAPRRLWLPTSAGGGNVYNEAITESLSSSDAIACAAAFARAASEAALATDSQSATGTLAAAASESAPATDAPVSVLVASAAVSESDSAADAVSAGAASYDVTVTEAASAADAVSVIATRVAAVSEALSAADAYTVTATMGAAVSENGSAADAVNWGGASYSVDIAETGTLADAVSAALQALAAISEVAGATDTPVAIISAGAAVLESAAAADLLAAARQITALLSEPATATDAVTFDADNVINAGIEESANATDGYVAVLIDGFLVVTASPRRVLTAGASRPANLAGAMRPHNLPGRGR